MSDFELFKPYSLSPDTAYEVSHEGRRSVLHWLVNDGHTEARDAFAAAIIEFNETSEDPRSVTKLNEAFRKEATSDFGLDPVTYLPGGSREGRSYEEDLALARIRTIVVLYDEYSRLEKNLDAAADRLARDLVPISLSVRAM